MYLFLPAYLLWFSTNVMLGEFARQTKKWTPYPRSICG